MAEAVKVAVRVRPFNDREKKRNAVVIIDMNGNTTTIKDPEQMKGEPKKFAFDYSYWSHDSFKERADGYLEPTNSKYADQQKVFDDLGRGVLDNAWKGYNCSLFAYGQTGSGKSYSMVGYGTNKGIVPISCDELFKAIEAKRASAGKGEEYQVSFSMLEIYNEQVRDLLNPKSLNVKGGLKVRQNPKKGFYVESLLSVAVNSYKEIDNKMNEGTKNRTVASTQMNATSSRAHTIVAINFTQKTPNAAGQSMTKTSSINLVDLAGSERADSTGATGDRLKEGSAINQSLSTLGNVIKALADQSSGNKKVMVPFRDSVLTKLLKNALGGNSKTVMIAALSPADINYEETLSTLRFADRAKAIKTTATVNESPTDKLIRELREENDKLKKMLEGGQIPAGMLEGGGGAEGDSEALADMEEQLRKNQEDMEAMQMSWQEKMKEREEELRKELAAQKKDDEQKKSVPHFWNLNEDAALTGMISHFCPNGKTRIGSKKAEKAPEMALSGLGIQPDHAVVDNSKNNKVMLIPSKGAKVLLNGNAITSKKELHHNDRVLLGSSNLFVFHHPQDFAKQQKAKKVVENPKYETAQEEIAKNSGLAKFTGDGKSKEDLLLQEDLVQIWPMINEANAMSEELNKKVKFEIALISPQARGRKDGRTEVCVKMLDLKTKNEFLWERNKFLNRKYLMQEMYQNYVEGDKDWDLPKEKNPFWEDPSQEVLIGSVHVFLQSLAYMIEMEECLKVTDYKGGEQGQLAVAILPCKADGKDIGDEYVDEPSELIGKELHFKLKIDNARGLPKKFAKTFCRYKLYLEEKTVNSKELGGMNPDYGHQQQFDFKPVTKQLVEYLENDSLVIEVYGRQEDLPDSSGDLSTEELMMKAGGGLISGGKEPTDIESGASTEHNDDVDSYQYRLASESALHKRRMERSEIKLRKIRALIDQAQKSKQATIKVEELEKIMRGGQRLKAIAALLIQSEKAKNESLGQNTSQACTIQ